MMKTKSYEEIKEHLLRRYNNELFDSENNPKLKDVGAIYPVFDYDAIEGVDREEKIRNSLKLSFDLYLLYIQQLKKYGYPKKFTFGVYIPVDHGDRKNILKIGKIFLAFTVVDSIDKAFVFDKVSFYQITKLDSFFNIALNQLREEGELEIFYHKSKIKGLDDCDSFYVLQIVNIPNLISEKDLHNYYKSKK